MLEVIFFSSLVLVVLMVIIQTYEFEKNKETFVSKFFAQFDERVEAKITHLFTWIYTKRERIHFLVTHEFPRHTRYFFLLIKKSYDDKVTALAINTRGNRILKKDAVVSPFLQDLSKGKTIGGTGRIVDSAIHEVEKRG